MTSQEFLVMAPGGRDAAVIIGQLEKAGMAGVVATGDTLLAAIAASRLGGAILTIEALRSIDKAHLRFALAAQPPWSDCPLLILTLRADRYSGSQAFDSLGNVILLERPLHPLVLVQAARQALRARDRQYKSGAYLRHKEAAEAQLRVAAETFQARVIARTVQLSDALAEKAALATRLHAREEQYRLTIELSNQIPWSANADGKFIGVGKRWVPLTGPLADLETVADLPARVHREDLDQVVGEWRDAQAHGIPLDAELRLRMQEGVYHWHRVRAAPQFAPDRSIFRWYGTIEDVEESKQADIRLQAMQAELIHVSRLSAMGAMASTLAHELNQPLTATTNFLRGSRRLLEQGLDANRDQLITALASADRSAARAGEIVRRLREMVTRGGVARRSENLAALIREACALALLDIVTLGISYRVNIADETVMVDVDRIQIQQVLVNLLRNAVQALADLKDGWITIKVRSIEGFSEVIVSDNGPGFPESTEARLFESFNTSKPDGMGIGLSISRTIIEAHGGHISRAPNQGTGAAIRFTVPNSHPAPGVVAVQDFDEYSGPSKVQP